MRLNKPLKLRKLGSFRICDGSPFHSLDAAAKKAPPLVTAIIFNKVREKLALSLIKEMRHVIPPLLE